MPYAFVNTGVVIKQACIINMGVLIAHDCILDDGCHVGTGAIVKGENHLLKGTKVDLGEVIPLRFYK